MFGFCILTPETELIMSDSNKEKEKVSLFIQQLSNMT